MGKISGGTPVYLSRLAANVGSAYECFSQSTSNTLFPILIHASLGWYTPPFSLSVIHCTAYCRISHKTRIVYVFSLCSSYFCHLAARRYFSNERWVSLTKIWCWQDSQVSIRRRSHRRISCVPNVCWSRCSINVSKKNEPLGVPVALAVSSEIL